MIIHRKIVSVRPELQALISVSICVARDRQEDFPRPRHTRMGCSRSTLNQPSTTCSTRCETRNRGTQTRLGLRAPQNSMVMTALHWRKPQTWQVSSRQTSQNMPSRTRQNSQSFRRIPSPNSFLPRRNSTSQPHPNEEEEEEDGSCGTRAMPPTCLLVSYTICLRARYAMPRTDIAHALSPYCKIWY